MIYSGCLTRIDFEKINKHSSELLSLSEREKKILSLFRKLTPEKQQTLIELFSDL